MVPVGDFRDQSPAVVALHRYARYAVSDRCAAEHATMVKGNRPANVLGRRAIQARRPRTRHTSSLIGCIRAYRNPKEK